MEFINDIKMMDGNNNNNVTTEEITSSFGDLNMASSNNDRHCNSEVSAAESLASSVTITIGSDIEDSCSVSCSRQLKTKFENNANQNGENELLKSNLLSRTRDDLMKVRTARVLEWWVSSSPPEINRKRKNMSSDHQCHNKRKCCE